MRKLIPFRTSELCNCPHPSALVQSWYTVQGQPESPSSNYAGCIKAQLLNGDFFAGLVTNSKSKKSKVNQNNRDNKSKAVRSKLEDVINKGGISMEVAEDIIKYVLSKGQFDKKHFREYLSGLGVAESLTDRLSGDLSPLLDTFENELTSYDFPVFKLSRRISSVEFKDLKDSIPKDISDYLVMPKSMPFISSRLTESGNASGKITMSNKPDENVTPLMWMLINMECQHWDSQILYSNTMGMCYDLDKMKLSVDNLSIFLNMWIDACTSGSNKYNEKSTINRAVMHNLYKHVDSSVKSLRYTGEDIKAFNSNLRATLEDHTKDISGTLGEFRGITKITYMRPLLLYTQNAGMGMGMTYQNSYSLYLELDPKTSVGGLSGLMQLNNFNSVYRSDKYKTFYINVKTDYQRYPLSMQPCEAALMKQENGMAIHPMYFGYDIKDSPASVVGEHGFIPVYVNRFNRPGFMSIMSTMNTNDPKNNGRLLDTTRLQGMMKSFMVKDKEFRLRGAIVARTYEDMPPNAYVNRSRRNRVMDPNTYWHTEAYLFDKNNKIYQYSQYMADDFVNNREKVLERLYKKKYAKQKEDRLQAMPGADLGNLETYERWITDPITQIYISNIQNELDCGKYDKDSTICDKTEAEVLDLIATKGIFLMFTTDTEDSILDYIGCM